MKNDLAQRILSEEQVFRLFALEPNQRNALILRTLDYTGLRVGEICALTWQDLQPRSEFEGQAMVFGNGGKTRVVLVSEKIWRSRLAIKGESGKDAPVFPSQKGGHLDASQVFRIVRAVGERAGIENISPH